MIRPGRVNKTGRTEGEKNLNTEMAPGTGTINQQFETKSTQSFATKRLTKRRNIKITLKRDLLKKAQHCCEYPLQKQEKNAAVLFSCKLIIEFPSHAAEEMNLAI